MKKRFFSFFLSIAIVMTMLQGSLFQTNAYSEAYPLPVLTGNMAEDTANIAKSQLDYTEESGTVYGAWWNSVTNWGVDYTNLSWCAMFACWCADQAGAGLNMAYDKNGASTPLLLKWYQENAAYDGSFSSDPQAGDLIFFGSQSGSPEHVAIVTEYNASSNRVSFVGGNQSGGKVTSGSCRWANGTTWGSQYVLGYGRPNYADPHDAACPGRHFADMPAADHWAHGSIDFAVANGLFGGVSETEFAPDGNMTRAMYVTVLGRLAGVTVSEDVTTKFSDVPAGQWYTGYVNWAADNGIVGGVDETHFAPNDSVTREQMCKMMVEYCSYAGIELQNINEAVSFKDADEISDWAKEYVSQAQTAGFVNGDNGSFHPLSSATRAQVATIFMNFAQNYDVL